MNGPLIAVFLILTAALAAAQCNTGLANVTLPDNGNVCDLLADPDPVETTCEVAISSGLNAALQACAGDTFIEVMLDPLFDEQGPFVFPDVKGITLLGGGASALRGGNHAVEGNRTALAFLDLVFDGEGTEDTLFTPPLRSNNLTLNGVLMLRFRGRWAVIQEACEEDVSLNVIGSYFFDNYGASLFHSGLYSYNVQNNVFDRCGGFSFGATFLKTHWANNGIQVFFNNSQWVLFDEQPPTCVTYLDGGEHLRCRDGVFECENLGAALATGDCPRDVNKTFINPATNQPVTELLFRPFCRRYAPCQCEEVVFRDVSNVSAIDFSQRVGDLIYPFVTLPCQPGGNLVAGGAIGSVAPLQFVDPSFEQDDNPGAGLGWATSGDVILDNAVRRPKSRTGSKRVICEGKKDQWFEQPINFTLAGSYLVSFYGARRDGQRKNYGGGFVELYLDGMQQVTLQDPLFEDTLASDRTYYEFLFPPINVAVPGQKLLRIRCNFVNTQNLEFAIDDVASRESGLEVVEFDGGSGLGPPFLADPLDFLAGNPLTSDAFIGELPCPACPEAPDRPPDLPCNYPIQDSFECFRTIYDGALLCLEPDLFNVGVGAFVNDSSFENATFFWTEVLGSPVVVPTGTPGTVPARTGGFFINAPPNAVVAIEQSVVFPDSAIYTLSLWGLRRNAAIGAYSGKFFQLFVDGLLIETKTFGEIAAVLPAPNFYGQFVFDPFIITAGPHTVRIVVDMTGGFLDAGFQIDDFQFLGALAAPSATPTPTPSPSAAPLPPNITVPCNGTNITLACPGNNATLVCNGTVIVVPCVPIPTVDVPCNGTFITAPCVGDNVTVICNGTNVTVPCKPPPLYPPDQLRCIEEVVYLGEEPFADGCIVPGDLLVEFDGQDVTANECVTVLAAQGCVLPEMFDFELNNTDITCLSLSTGMMVCDCSTAKLLELSNRTVSPELCAYEFDKVPRTATGLFIRENRAQQLAYGGCARRIEFDSVVESSGAQTDFFDVNGVAREILRQNDRMWGQIPDAGQPNGVRPGPRFRQDALEIYAQVCDDLCPQFNPTRLGTNIQFCVVDNAGADFDGTVYPTIQEALSNGACAGPGRAIWVRESENFYEEELEFKRDNVIIFATGNATLVGTHRVKGAVNVLFVRGLRWIHNGRNGQPLIDIDDAGDLRNLTLLNNEFSGNGVKDGGIIRNRNRQIRTVEFRYNLVRNFQTSVLRLVADDITVTDNTFIDCSGRLVQVRYTNLTRTDSNVYIDSRGAPDTKKPSMFELRLKGSRDFAPCKGNPSLCSFRRNVQREVAEEPEDSEDFKETGILLRNGAFYLETIRDNVVIKARTGMRLRAMDFIVPVDLLTQIGPNRFLEVLQFFNPLVRNTRTRRESNGEDFMIDGFADGSRVSKLRCSFPDCVPPERRPQQCIVNLNFESLHSEQFGWETFTNTTQASFFCPLNLIQVTVFGGARIIPERLAVRRPFSNNVARPLVDEPTNEEIMLGDAPVPDRFEARGVPVDLNDVAYFASLLDANTTYGFGLAAEVFERTDLTCGCPGINLLISQAVNYLSTNCTDLVGPAQDPNICADLLASDPGALACVTGDDSELTCVQVGQTIIGAILIGVFDCSLPLTVTRNVLVVVNTTLVNGTLVNVTDFRLVNFTEFRVQQGVIGDLSLCYFSETDVFRPVFDFSTLNQCVEPVYWGVGSNFRALNITWTDVAFYLDYGAEYEDDELEVPILTTLEPAIDMHFLRVRFNFRGVEPPGRMEGLQLQQGLDVPDQYGRKKRNRRVPVWSRTLIENCTFENALFFATTLNNTQGSGAEQSEIDEFPYIVALDIEVVNRLADDPTEIDIWWTLFSDIDRTSVRVRFANATRFFDCLGKRTGGRSLNTPAAYWFEANPASVNAVVHLRHPNVTQTRPVTYPFLGDLAVPAYQTMIWIAGLRDQAVFDCTQFGDATVDECLASVYPSCCPALIVEGGFVCGLPYGLRIVGERDVMNKYILSNIPGMPVPIFDDELAALRELALVNDVSIDGTVCDIVLGPPDQDWREEHLCCEEACPPRPPSRCRINSEDPRIPGHPWEGIYWYTDINDCPATCQASSGVCELEVPQVSGTPYEVRLDFATTEPPVLVYEATWSGPVTIVVTATLPMGGLVSPPAVTIPIEWADNSLPPEFIEILSGNPLVQTLAIEVDGRLQMPAGVPEAVPTETPPGWLMDIRVRYTFCVPGNMQVPVSSFPVSFAYMSPAINVNTPDFSYAAVLMVNWTWNAMASLQTATARELRGVGMPELLCNAHSVAGPDIIVSDLKYLHADPCLEVLDPVECPCTVPGLATWQQRDVDMLGKLELRDSAWDGRTADALAIDGDFWGHVTVRGSSFVDYRDAQPSYVLRLTASPTENCCADPACVNEFRVVANTFMGADSVAMTGNVVRVGPTEFARVVGNTAIDAGFQDTGHPEAALFYIESCPGLPLLGAMSENIAERSSGAVVTTRVPPNDCYWTAYEVDELSSSPSFEIARNEYSQAMSAGAQICIRAVNWPKSSPSSDCKRALRQLNAANPFCDGALWDSVKAPCDKDVCLARTLGCPGVDPVCDAATIPPCSTDDGCLACEGRCGRPTFDPPVWFIILSAVVAAILLCYLLYCCACLIVLCIAARPRRRVIKRKSDRRVPAIETMNESQALLQLTRQVGGK